MNEWNLLQVGAAAPAPTLQKASWLQHALSTFVALRKSAAALQGKDELLCMPVVITASTHASASSLSNTANARSRVKDIHLRPLTDMQMQALVVSLAKSSKHDLAIPSPLPPQLVLLLQLLGGNPRMLCQALCLLAGSDVVLNEQFPAGQHPSRRHVLGLFMCGYLVYIGACMMGEDMAVLGLSDVHCQLPRAEFYLMQVMCTVGGGCKVISTLSRL